MSNYIRATEEDFGNETEVSSSDKATPASAPPIWFGKSNVGRCFRVVHTKKSTGFPGENLATVPESSKTDVPLYAQRYRILEVHDGWVIVDSLDRKEPQHIKKRSLVPYQIKNSGPTFQVSYRRINKDQIREVTEIQDPERVKPGTIADLLGIKDV